MDRLPSVAALVPGTWLSLAVYAVLGVLSWLVYKVFILPHVTPLRKIPGPPHHWLWGNTKEMLHWHNGDLELSMTVFRRFSDTYGSVYRFFRLLGGQHILVTDPAVMKHILVTNSKNYRKPDTALITFSDTYGSLCRFHKLIGGSDVLVTDPAVMKHILVTNCKNYRKPNIPLITYAEKYGSLCRFFEMLGRNAILVTDPAVMKHILVTNSKNYRKPNIPLITFADRYGPVCRFTELLGKQLVMVAEPSVMKHMLVTNVKNYQKPRDAFFEVFKAVIGEGLVLLEGADHATHKRLISPSFNNAAIKRMVRVFEEHGRRLADMWAAELEAADAGGGHITAHVQTKLSHTALDVIGETAFGYTFNAIENPNDKINHAFQSVLEGDVVNWKMLFPGYFRLPLSDVRELKAAIAIMHGKVDDIIRYKQGLIQKGQGQDAKDILGIMMLARDEETGQGLSDAELKNEVMTIMAAGHETTSTGMSWFLYCMAQHPEVQHKVREEVLQVLPEPDTPITWETLDKFHYLGLCIKECLRMYPPVPATIRQAQAADTFLGKYHIPAKTVCAIGLAAMMKSSRYFEDPDTFRPERFDSSDAESKNMYQFLPFLIGPRMCLGYKFALIEMKVILACLLRKLHFESIEGTSFRPSYKNRITMRPDPPLILHATKAE